MKIKVFGARTRAGLEEEVNKWLRDNPVTPQSCSFQYGMVYLDDPDLHIVEHTLVLLYVPMMPIR